MDKTPFDSRRAPDFASQAEGRQRGSLGELVSFMMTTKKWWLTPIVILILMLGVLVMLSSTAAAPFIYTLF
jgi:hypothetical protein